MKYLLYLYNVVCRLFGHNWKYNFSSLPNKAICTRCNCKAVLDLKVIEWKSVNNFGKEKRTDKQLAQSWHK